MRVHAKPGAKQEGAGLKPPVSARCLRVPEADRGHTGSGPMPVDTPADRGLESPAAVLLRRQRQNPGRTAIMARAGTLGFSSQARPRSCQPCVTKFGGQPCLAESPQWPLSRATGQPMRFIAQVALEPRSLPGPAAAWRICS